MLRLHMLRHHIDNAPIAQTTVEETLRLRLLRHVTHVKHGLKNDTCHSVSFKGKNVNQKDCVRGAPSLTQDIAGCITTINNHLFKYMVTAQSSTTTLISDPCLGLVSNVTPERHF